MQYTPVLCCALDFRPFSGRSQTFPSVCTYLFMLSSQVLYQSHFHYNKNSNSHSMAYGAQRLTILLNIRFHAPMERFQLELYYFYCHFFHRPPTQKLCYLSCRPFVVHATCSTETAKPVENVALATKNLQKRKQLVIGTTVKKIGNKNT